MPPADRLPPDGYLGAFRVVSDAAEVRQAGEWMVAALHGWGLVSGLVPDAFESFGRIFHPALSEVTGRDLPLRATGESKAGVPVHAGRDGVLWREVSWREVAEANGTAAHPAMEWTSITGSYDFGWSGSQPGIWEEVPEHGSLPPRVARVLCEVLAAFTTTPDRCWCAVWEGYGDLIGLRSYDRLPRLSLEHRPMILAEGPVSAVAETSFSDPALQVSPGRPYRSPSLWWPDDRAWCVGSDVDLQTTYLGASSACVDRLIGDGRIEAMRVTADQSLAFDADTVNPPPAGDRSRA